MSEPTVPSPSRESDQLPAVEEAAVAEQVLAVHRRLGTWRRFLQHRLALTGAILLALVALVSLFAPLLEPYSPQAIDLKPALRHAAQRRPLAGRQ